MRRSGRDSEDRERSSCLSGFTLLEIMLVVLTIGLLAAIALPSFRKARTTAQLTSLANNIKVFGDAFDLYAMEHRGYPPDSHMPLPYHLPNTVIEEYLDTVKWSAETPVGGYYNWEGPDSYPYAGISLFEPTASQEDLELLDIMLDDGDLTQGKFRQTPNGRYTCIIDE